MPAPSSAPQIFFAGFNVTSQVFYRTAYTFSIVNLRPLLPGHVLICPLTASPSPSPSSLSTSNQAGVTSNPSSPPSRISALTPPQVTDLFLTAQRVSRMLERVYGAKAINLAVQDGKEAGQSVPHVHVHLIPRGSSRSPTGEGASGVVKDIGGEEEKGQDEAGEKQPTPSTTNTENAIKGDEIYRRLENEDGDVGLHLQLQAWAKTRAMDRSRSAFPAVEDAARRNRSQSDMEQEASWLAREMAREERREADEEAS